MEENGEISPIIRLEKVICVISNAHCSAEYYMDRHTDKVLKVQDKREKIDLMILETFQNKR